VYYEIGPDVLFALSEATDGIANPPYVEKISGGGGRDAMHCGSKILIVTNIANIHPKKTPLISDVHLLNLYVMSDYKLTLRISTEVAEKGKLYAKRHKKSLSQLVEDQLLQLFSQESPQINESIPDDLLFLKGLAKGNTPNNEIDSRWDYVEKRIFENGDGE
jgi:hypothetical protein